MRIISNQELLYVAGGAESEDDPEATLLEDNEGNSFNTVGGGGDPSIDYSSDLSGNIIEFGATKKNTPTTIEKAISSVARKLPAASAKCRAKVKGNAEGITTWEADCEIDFKIGSK